MLFEEGVITADEMAVMNDLAARNQWNELMSKEGLVYILTPLSILGKVEDHHPVICCLTLLYDIFISYPLKARCLHDEPSQVFLPLKAWLLSGDEMIAGQVARLLSVLGLYMLSQQELIFLVLWDNYLSI